MLLTEGDDLAKVTELGSLLLKERLALLGRNSPFGFGTYRPPHDELSGYLLSVREELFLPALIQVAARNGLKGAFADELAAAIQQEPRLQSELVATLANGIGSAPLLAVTYLRHLAREGATFLQLDQISSAEPSPQGLFLRKALDPTFVIESGALIDAARRYYGETTLDELLPANGIRIDAKVIREATDCLVIPRHLSDAGFRHNPETIGRLIQRAELPAGGPTALEVVVQHLREKYGPQAGTTMDEGAATRRLASLYTLGQLGALSKPDIDQFLSEVVSQSQRKKAPGETTLLALVENLLRSGSNTMGRAQQPMVVLRGQLRTVLANHGIRDLEGFGRYLVEQHGIKPGVLSDVHLSSLAELIDLNIPWKQGSRDLSELTSSIQKASAERTAREATLSFKVSALMGRLFGGR